MTVEVLTTQAADLFEGAMFRGPSGTRIAEPYGTKLTLECRTKGYKGSVAIVFDGSRTAVMCNALALPPCVGGLKPFNGECVADPSDSPTP